MLLDKVLKFYCLLHILINFDVNFWQLILTCNFFFSLASPVVISYNGASGDYPSCTDLAYQAAIADGANIIDCPVQISKDGIPFCFSSINLMEGSTAAQSPFRTRTTAAPELFIERGLFSFSLTWEEIQTLKRKFYLFANSIFLVSQKVRIFFINAWKSWFVLLLRWILVYIDGISYSYLLRWVTFILLTKLNTIYLPNSSYTPAAAISSPYSGNNMLFRNPRFKNEGNIISLSQFIDTAANTSLSGVLIRIEVILFYFIYWFKYQIATWTCDWWAVC